MASARHRKISVTVVSDCPPRRTRTRPRGVGAALCLCRTWTQRADSAHAEKKHRTFSAVHSRVTSRESQMAVVLCACTLGTSVLQRFCGMAIGEPKLVELAAGADSRARTHLKTRRLG